MHKLFPFSIPSTPPGPAARYILGGIAGVLLYLSSPSAIGFSPLAWCALVPLLMACRDTTPLKAACLGLFCGLIYYSLLLYWVVFVLGKYGYLPLWISLPALLLLALYMSAYCAIFTTTLSWSMKTLPSLWAAPVLWVSLDLIRSRLFSGFPWQDLAYSQYDTPFIIQIADLFGHHGVTFLIILVNSTLFTAISLYANTSNSVTHRSAPCKGIFISLMIIAAAMGYNGFRFITIDKTLSDHETLALGIIQGNIPQDEKWSPDFQIKTVNKYIALSEAALNDQKPDLLIWPETALPFYPLESPLFPEVVNRLLRPHDITLLTGIPHREKKLPDHDFQYYNSSFLVTSDGNIIGRYDKQHLVPFGEYIPLRYILRFLSPLVESLGDMSPGEINSLMEFHDTRIGTLICYESIFPEIARHQAANHAQLLINITNDAWYGKSSAPVQLLSMSIFRSVENRKSQARAANTGISAFIDPLGRVRQQTALFESAYLVDTVALFRDRSFYTLHGHHFATICLLISGGLLLYVSKKSR